MIDKVRKTLSDYKMIRKGDKILIAFSGGPDSLCLLYLLLELKKEFGLKLHLAHLNHCLRRDASGDVNYIRWLSRKFKVPLTIAKKDIPKIARQANGSIEMVARNVRYRFLAETAGKAGANKIALGHNQDDQIETFLLNFLRGAGTTGLSGMPPKRKLAGLKRNKNIYIIRPLIRIARREIMGCLNEQKLRPRMDSSNLSPAYKRNRIRWKLLPLLKKEYNPGIDKVIVRMRQIFEEENDFWQNYLKKIFKDIILRGEKGSIQIDIKKLLAQPKAVQNRIIQAALKQLVGELMGFNYEHITALKRLCHKDAGRKTLSLPHGIQAVKNYGKLILGRFNSAPDYFFEFPIKSPGGNFFPNLFSKLEIHFKPYSKSNIQKHIDRLRQTVSPGRFEAILDKDRLRFPLVIRNRRPGDKFQQLGSNRFPKLKNYFINKKVSFSERRQVPLLVDSGGEIIWVIGREIADWARVTEKTRKVLKLKYSLPA